MTFTDINEAAYCLLAGGWTPEDREELMEEYSLTEEETDDIVKEMGEIQGQLNINQPV